ncbi:MAG TPA: alpha/beta hydrolase family protein [Anaerolineae bacterium]
MALLNLEFKSEILGKATKVKVIINRAARPPYPTFYLLHGYSDNESVWSRNTSLERYAQSYPFMLVMPDGACSWYCDSRLGRYETYIRQELVSIIDTMFHTRKLAKYRAIGGLSMGGYGALKLGLKFPQVFGSITAHSSAIGFMRWGASVNDIRETPIIFDGLDTAANDPYELAMKLPAKQRPHLYFDCGRDDFLYEDSQKFDAHLRKAGFPHTYRRFEGAHEWSYWDTHVQDALKFHVKAMAL